MFLRMLFVRCKRMLPLFTFISKASEMPYILYKQYLQRKTIVSSIVMLRAFLKSNKLNDIFIYSYIAKHTKNLSILK